MNVRLRTARSLSILCLLGLVARGASAQSPTKEFQPTIGQPGKDVVWVPTPEELVELMLDMAKVTPQDFVVDLGSGDGRNVIAAAKRGARALGVEYNKQLVELSRREAAKAGVGDRATFARGDMFAADISKADVLALFLLPSHMFRLSPKFLKLKPGSRIVSNTFGILGWDPDETQMINNECESWCTALLWYVPAPVAGNWRFTSGDPAAERTLKITQQYQKITGTLTMGGDTLPLEGRLRGEVVDFTAGGVAYTGRVRGDAMEGTFQSGDAHPAWSARRRR